MSQIWHPPTNVKIITVKYSSRYWSITRQKLNTRKPPGIKNKRDILYAKQVKLDHRKKKGVYTEHIDEGQTVFPYDQPWKKVANSEKLVKTRLCARGYEEEQRFLTDSPTCCQECLRLRCCTISLEINGH